MSDVSEFLAKHGACNDGRKFALKFELMSQAWDRCERVDWLFWMLKRTVPVTKEQSVRVAIAAAESCIHDVPKGDARPRKAIDAARRWLEEPTEDNRLAAADAALDALVACDHARAVSDYAASNAADAAACAAGAAAASIQSVAAGRARDALLSSDCGCLDAWEDRDFCDMIRSIVPNPFLP